MWLTIAIYVVLMAAIGFVTGRKTKNMSDFTVGGRNAGAWMSAFSYGTAYFSAVMFIGYAGGTGWKYGIWGVLPGIGNAIIGSLCAWLVLARRTRRVTRELNVTTMPQLFEKSFVVSNLSVVLEDLVAVINKKSIKNIIKRVLNLFDTLFLL